MNNNKTSDLEAEKLIVESEMIAENPEMELAIEFVEAVENSKLEIDDKINFLLTKGGLKPASVIELPIRIQTHEETVEFFKEDEINEIVELVKKSDLEYYVEEKKIAEEGYRTKAEPEIEKISKGEQAEIFIANSEEELGSLRRSWEVGDQEMMGIALGFPVSAAEAFVKKRARWNIDNMPEEIRTSDAILFFTPVLSQDNWQEEIQEGKRRADFIRRNSPKIYAAKMSAAACEREKELGRARENQADIDAEKIEGLKESLRMTDMEKYVKGNLQDFENVEIKKLSELPFWNKINKFLADKKISDGEVIIIGDEERWRSLYGSNDSKSSHRPMAIILKKEIFDQEDISEGNMAWLIHEIGHLEFYKDLGDKLDAYMEEYHASGEYTNSAMEKQAFELQFEFLKSIGKTKAECLDFIEKYLAQAFAGNEEEAKNKELKQIMKYIDDIF
jgi:hypothetical protein